MAFLFLAVIFAKGLSVGGATEQCSSSTDTSLSPGFLPAALFAIPPLGYGTCHNGTCTTPPASCPSTSCCLSPNDPRGGSCGCLITQGGTQTCADPKTLALDLIACSVDGKKSESTLQISFVSVGAECVESVKVKQTVSNDGSPWIHITATTCFPPQRNERLDPYKNLVSKLAGIVVNLAYLGFAI